MSYVAKSTYAKNDDKTVNYSDMDATIAWGVEPSETKYSVPYHARSTVTYETAGGSKRMKKWEVETIIGPTKYKSVIEVEFKYADDNCVSLRDERG